MSKFLIQSYLSVDQETADTFLQEMFGEVKGRFLRESGEWWNRGGANRHFVVHQPDGRIAAHFATVPTCCQVNGRSLETLWWIDLIVNPQFRRQGLQRLMDDAVRGRPGLKMGVPNYAHSLILARHGWTIKKFQIFLLALNPLSLRSVQSSKGLRGLGLRAGAGLFYPLARLWRRRLLAHSSRTARVYAIPDAAVLTAIYRRYLPADLITNDRTEEFFTWRYLNAPYREQLRFYLAGPAAEPTHYLIARQVTFQGLTVTRILDLFGDFGETAVLYDLLATAVRQAAIEGSSQVTLMASLPEVQTLLRRLGFLFNIPIYYCYHTDDPETAIHFSQSRYYWTLGDSDNDPPY